MKTCTKCDTDKPFDDFYKNKSKADGYSANCKLCHSKVQSASYVGRRDKLISYQKLYKQENPSASRRQFLQRTYGLTLEQFDEMLERQNGLCKICLHPPKQGDNLRVDHCHKTGIVRGLLCNSCNIGIGLLRESEEIMIRAIGYLKSV